MAQQGQSRLDQYLNGFRVLLDRFLWSRYQPTMSAPHIRDRNNTHRLLNNFVIASIPCALIGCWNLGDQINITLGLLGGPALEGWRVAVILALGMDLQSGAITAALIHGLLYFLPILLTAVLTGALWEVVFAVGRQKPVDEGLLANAWLFSLILPPSIPLLQVVIGMTFAMVVAKGIYGGTGRYLVSPPVLGLSFLTFSYSNVLFGPETWVPVPGYVDLTTIQIAVLEGGVRALELVDYSWLQLFIGNQPGPVGVTSALACLMGAAWLIYTGSGSWRIMAGSAIAMVLTVSLLQAIGPIDDPLFDIPWYWHAVLGGWAFGTVFLATDPMAAATTRAGRWAFGIMVGLLTILVRLTNPAYFEGVVFAILLASIFAPLCDYFVVERNIKRRRARLAAFAAPVPAAPPEPADAQEVSR